MKRLHALLLLAFLTAVLSQAQPGRKAAADALQITGHVEEFGMSRGLSDVQVTLERYEGGTPSSFVPRTKVGALSTDTNGAFAFSIEQPGTYRIEVSKDGYIRPGGLRGGYRNSADVSLDKTNPTADLHFSLGRPGELSGRFVDEDTHQPVAGLAVVMCQYGYGRGHVELSPGGYAITGKDGRFVANKLSPADYVVTIQPRITNGSNLTIHASLRNFGEDRLLTQFSDKDWNVVDEDYDNTYWPGGSGVSSAFPVTVGSGARVDLGLLTIKKVPKYRVRVSFVGTPCRLGDRTSMDVVAAANHWLSTKVGTVPCGKEFVMRGFVAGAYQLEVTRYGKGLPDLKGSVQFNVADENIDVTVPMSPGVDIDGKFTVAEGASVPDYKGIRLVFSPTDWVIQNGPARIDAEGKFRVTGLTVREYQLELSGIPQTHYVKQILYNGQTLAGNVLTLDPHAQAQTLEFVLDDKPATVSGSVRDDDNPVPQPHVVLVRWPPTGFDLFSSLLRTTGDAKGQFNFAGLAPGDYRILAVQADAIEKLQRPHILEDLLRKTDSFTLGARQFQNINVTLTHP